MTARTHRTSQCERGGTIEHLTVRAMVAHLRHTRQFAKSTTRSSLPSTSSRPGWTVPEVMYVHGIAGAIWHGPRRRRDSKQSSPRSDSRAPQVHDSTGYPHPPPIDPPLASPHSRPHGGLMVAACPVTSGSRRLNAVTQAPVRAGFQALRFSLRVALAAAPIQCHTSGQRSSRSQTCRP